MMFWKPDNKDKTALSGRESALREELARDVHEIAGRIGERNVHRRYEALARTADYIASELRAAGYEPCRQEFPSRDKLVSNIEAERRGSIDSCGTIIIGAHYDTVSHSPGANDNTSAVASCLALARAVCDRAPRHTLRFVFFANEEAPYFMTSECGSLQHAARCRARGEKIHAMLCLECMGSYYEGPGTQRYPAPLDKIYPTVGDFVAFVGNLRSFNLTRRALKLFRRHATISSAGIAMPAILPDLHRSDHRAFWLHGYNAIMITDTANFRYKYYHSPEDTPEKLNYDSLARVVAGLECALWEL